MTSCSWSQIRCLLSCRWRSSFHTFQEFILRETISWEWGLQNKPISLHHIHTNIWTTTRKEHDDTAVPTLQINMPLGLGPRGDIFESSFIQSVLSPNLLHHQYNQCWRVPPISGEFHFDISSKARGNIFFRHLISQFSLFAIHICCHLTAVLDVLK